MNSAPAINEDTILGFVHRHATQAVSVDYDQAQQTAQRVAALGFTGGGNVRLVQFLEDFRPDPKLKAYYEEHYPSCFFLTWRGLRRVLSTLKLWCDLPQHYARSVYGRDNFLVGSSDLLTMFSDFKFERPGTPEGSYLHYTSSGFQFDYPCSWEHVFRILPEDHE